MKRMLPKGNAGSAGARHAAVLGLVVAIHATALSMAWGSITYRWAKNLEIEASHFKAFHHHDWSSPASRSAAHILIVDKTSGNTVQRVISPALMHLDFTDDERFLVGLSTLTYENSGQLIVIRLEDGVAGSRQIRCDAEDLPEAIFGCHIGFKGWIYWYDEAHPAAKVVEYGGRYLAVRVKPVKPLPCGIRKDHWTPEQWAEFRCDDPPEFIEIPLELEVAGNHAAPHE